MLASCQKTSLPCSNVRLDSAPAEIQIPEPDNEQIKIPLVDALFSLNTKPTFQQQKEALKAPQVYTVILIR